MRIIEARTSVIVCVTYYRPDYSSLLNEFLWSTEDVVPELRRVHKFLNFWKEEIEAVIKSVEIAIPDRPGGASWRSVDYFKGSA